jgi:lipoprotein-releasing system permease protein
MQFHSVHKKKQRKSIYNSVSIIKTLKQDKRIIDVAAKVTASVFLTQEQLKFQVL